MIVRLAALLLALPLSLMAQQSPRGGDGYLFKRPFGTLSIRAGAARPNASGSVFSLADSLLTLSPNRYAGFAVTVESSMLVGDRGEVVLGVSVNNRKVGSEYRDWTDSKDLPIEQSTRFNRVPVSIGYKWNLRPSGRTVSRLAWVPNGFVPYVAAGGGAMWWSFRQEGDFVDFQTANLEVFRSVLQDRGWAPLAYAATGAAWHVTPSMAVTGEARFDASRSSLGGSFDGFRNIGLSGVGVTAGVQLRY
jgi:hypothetical protein